MKKGTLTIAFAFIVSALFAQQKQQLIISGSYTAKSPAKITAYEADYLPATLKVLDTTYAVTNNGSQVTRTIKSTFKEVLGKDKLLTVKDKYNGKTWDFYSVTVEPYIVESTFNMGGGIWSTYPDNQIRLTSPMTTP